MSYYSSSTLLDPYCVGGSRYDSYTSPAANSYSYNAVDKYYKYLDDLSIGGSSRSSCYSGVTSDLGSSRLAGTSSYLSTYSSSYRPTISRSPAYDKYGKELSNYERWKLQNGCSDILLDDKRTTPTTTAGRRRENTVKSYEKETSPQPISSRYSASSSSAALTARGTSLAPSYSTYSSSSSRPSFSHHSFPASVSAKLSGYDVRDVRGDGGCYYRCLSVYFTDSEESYNKYRREVMSYIREHLDNYSSMIKSEVGYASTSDYFSRKTRTDLQEFAETTEIIATCCLYNTNIHVLALVPGKRQWEWLHFDPSIGSGRPSTASRDIYLYNQGSVHFMLCTPK